MPLLIGLGLIAGLIWLAIVVIKIGEISPGTIAIGIACSLVLQVWFGHDFWHLNAGPVPLTLDRLCLGFVALLWIIGLVRQRGKWLNVDGMDFVVALWLIVIAVSTFTNDWEFRNKLPLSRLLFFNILPVAYYVILKHSPIQFGEIKLLQRTWVFLAVSLALMAVLEWRGWHSLIFPRYIITSSFQEFLGRGRGPLLNPMINGMIMTAGGAMAVLMLLHAGSRMRVFLFFAAGAIAIGLMATMTRSVWLAAVGIGAVFVLLPFGWRVRAGLALLGTCFLIIASPFVKEGLVSFKRDQNVSLAEMQQSVELRPILATVALEMIRERPVAGFGFGLYHKYKVPFHFSESSGLQLQRGLVYTQHNVFFAYAVETGLVGLGVFMAMLIMILLRSIRLLRDRDSDLEVRLLGTFGFAVVITYAFNGLFHDVSLIPMANCLLLITAGTVGRLTNADLVNVTSTQSDGHFEPACAP